MLFDGAELKHGDLVHDVAFGAGTVDNILEGEQKFTVEFNNRHYTYQANGVGHFPMKTLYWRDPIGGFLPTKDAKKWELFCELRKGIAQILAATNAVREH